jgi:hypothetical protein
MSQLDMIVSRVPCFPLLFRARSFAIHRSSPSPLFPSRFMSLIGSCSIAAVRRRHRMMEGTLCSFMSLTRIIVLLRFSTRTSIRRLCWSCRDASVCPCVCIYCGSYDRTLSMIIDDSVHRVSSHLLLISMHHMKKKPSPNY